MILAMMMRRVNPMEIVRFFQKEIILQGLFLIIMIHDQELFVVVADCDYFDHSPQKWRFLEYRHFYEEEEEIYYHQTHPATINSMTLHRC